MPPRRVVSLCPSITETLVEIGARDRLVAATRYCTRPKGVLRGLARIGGTKDPDVGRILEL
ncbi:MAG TPA: helical backbone metal receptor, partial [Thermoanaerobaculia bacterium]|nr:helical backbone metal receptor [Thermoanaerobaculia bacterium]